MNVDHLGDLNPILDVRYEQNKFNKSKSKCAIRYSFEIFSISSYFHHQLQINRSKMSIIFILGIFSSLLFPFAFIVLFYYYLIYFYAQSCLSAYKMLKQHTIFDGTWLLNNLIFLWIISNQSLSLLKPNACNRINK